MNYTESSLIEFVAAMSIKLEANQAAKGDSWVTSDMGFLRHELDGKLDEYWSMERDMERAGALVDIANFCMMLYLRHKENKQ